MDSLKDFCDNGKITKLINDETVTFFMKFIYPDNLYSIIKENWKKKKWEKEKIPPLPNKDIVHKLIEVVYHASFRTEEQRHLWYRVLYKKPWMPPKIDETDGIRDKINEVVAIKFKQPREFNVAELLKLAPAADPTQVLIGVYKKSERSKNLEIWGLIEAGTSWWNFNRHESDRGSVPPNEFTISSKEPGQVNISRGGGVLLSLKQGKLYMSSDDMFYNGPIAKFLEKGADKLYKELCKKLERKKFDYEGDDNYPRLIYIFFIQRILNRIRERFHGGALIMIPDKIDVNDTRLKDRVSIKYPCNYDQSWYYLIKDLIRHKKYYNLHFKLWDRKKITTNDYREVSNLNMDGDDNKEQITNAVGFLSALSGVDGAIVMTDKLRLLGFGAEIIALSPSLTKVKVITDLKKNKGEYKDINLFGTRHRSAFRFCSSFENGIVFIISEDGDIRVAKRVGSEVRLWSDFNIGSISF